MARFGGPHHIARRLARRLREELGVVLAECDEALCIRCDRAAVALNRASGMDYWQWSLRVETVGGARPYPTVVRIGDVAVGKPTEIGGVAPVSKIVRAPHLGLTRCERTGNIEVSGGTRP